MSERIQRNMGWIVTVVLTLVGWGIATAVNVANTNSLEQRIGRVESENRELRSDMKAVYELKERVGIVDAKVQGVKDLLQQAENAQRAKERAER